MSEERIFLVAEVVAALGIASGIFLVAYGLVREGYFPGKVYLEKYEAHIDRMVRLCFLNAKPRAILRRQSFAIALALAAFLATGIAPVLLVGAIAAAAPAAYLALERRRRQGQFTEQTDGFLLALANSLKAVPNIAAALAALMPVLQSPIREEIALALSELRVGNSVDQALLNVSARAQSYAFDGAVSALLVGRQVGGDVPKILETTAATIREMNRLEGFVRSKTAESNAQLWVLAGFPLLIAILFNLVSPGFFDPLSNTFTGQVVSVIAVGLWLSAVVLARHISKVDL